MLIEAAGQKFTQTGEFRYLGVLVTESAEFESDVHRQSRAA